MTQLEQVITTMVKLFMEYAGNHGNKHGLSKDELKQLLQKESQNPNFKVKSEDISEVMKTLDEDRDGEVNFEEFCRCVTILAKSHYYTLPAKEAEGKD